MDTNAIIERERFRARFQKLLAHVANYQYGCGDTVACVETAQRLLATDPCREDMHRLIMRCYTQQGERSRALHQYRLCTALLHTEFGAEPEPATTALFEDVRLAPAALNRDASEPVRA
jgi:DNA-binding SARP family transcriptional activator